MLKIPRFEAVNFNETIPSIHVQVLPVQKINTYVLYYVQYEINEIVASTYYVQFITNKQGTDKGLKGSLCWFCETHREEPYKDNI